MKFFLLLLFLGFSYISDGQINAVMPPEANAFYNDAMNTINPAVKSLIVKNASRLKGRNVNADSLLRVLQKDPQLKNIREAEIEAITVLIMVQASRNADADLKNLVVNMPKTQDENVSGFSHDKVQSIVANKSQIAKNVSIVMKKISRSELLIENLR
jgi:hypothetical protein